MRISTLILAAALAACDSTTRQSNPPPAIAVATATATVTQMPRTFEAGGVVRARTTATLASRLTAAVLTVPVIAGDRVRAGQPLMTFDGRELEANRARAAADASGLERAHAAAVADRVAAEAALTLAQASHRRYAALYAGDAASAQQVDEALSALRVAQARLAAADAQIEAAAAALEGAHQAEAAARATASYATLVAPFDGLITERLVDPGALATPGAPLLRIDDTRRFRLEVVVDESRVPSIAGGARVDVLLDDDSEGPAIVRGTVAEVSRALDAGSHSFVVKIDLPPAELRSGMFARARFVSGTHDVLTIPAAALVPRGQLSTVFVVSPDGRAQMRVIDTGTRGDDWVEVLAGVSAGEHVILSPARLRDGTPVTLVPPGARP